MLSNHTTKSLIFTPFRTYSTTASMLTAALFTFDAGLENAMEHPLRITGGILFPGQLERDEVPWLIVEVVSLDTDTMAKLDFSQLNKYWKCPLVTEFGYLFVPKLEIGIHKLTIFIFHEP